MISYLHLAQTVHLSCTDSNGVSKWIETRFHMTNVTAEIHWVRPKWFLSLRYVWRKPCNYLVSRLALCPNRPKEHPCVPRHLGVPSGASKTIFAPMVRSTQTEHLSCVKINTSSNMDQNEHPLEPRHLGVPLGASKTISVPMVRIAQTMHVTCTNTPLSPNGLKWDST
jgi:hypothetical protein